jgi:hypothetical protein
MNWIEILSSIFGAGGIFGFISYFLFFRESKRIKKAEADEKELSIWNNQIDILNTRLKDRDSKVDALYIELRQEQERKLELIEQCNQLELKIKLLIIQKCEVRGCVQRVPPSEEY